MSYTTECDGCGEKIGAGARYCSRCGEKQPWLDTDGDTHE